jgi:hypothetical protein
MCALYKHLRLLSFWGIRVVYNNLVRFTNRWGVWSLWRKCDENLGYWSMRRGHLEKRVFCIQPGHLDNSCDFHPTTPICSGDSRTALVEIWIMDQIHDLKKLLWRKFGNRLGLRESCKSKKNRSMIGSTFAVWEWTPFEQQHFGCLWNTLPILLTKRSSLCDIRLVISPQQTQEISVLRAFTNETNTFGSIIWRHTYSSHRALPKPVSNLVELAEGAVREPRSIFEVIDGPRPPGRQNAGRILLIPAWTSIQFRQ